MDPKQLRALNQCHRDILRDLDIDKQFLLSLYIDNLITEAQSKDIEHETSRRAKASKLMEVLPRRGPSIFPQFVNKLRRDYSWIAGKLDTEYEKAQKEMPKDINSKLIDVINNQLCPLVYGVDDQNSLLPSETHPGHLVNQLSDTVHTLQYRSYRALGISTRDPATTYMSLPRLIDRKVHSLQNSFNEMKSSLSEEKKKNKTNIPVDKKSTKEATKMKKELEKMKEANKKLDSSLKGRNKKIQSLSCENLTLQTQNRQLRDRVEELEKEALVYHRGAMITEWRM
ncbi:girdin-like [Mytilus edulis]